MFQSMERTRENIFENIRSITYFMRGGVQYEYLLFRCSYYERTMLARFIEHRLESESQKMYPVY